jgi:hypothetical protein
LRNTKLTLELKVNVKQLYRTHTSQITRRTTPLYSHSLTLAYEPATPRHVRTCRRTRDANHHVTIGSQFDRIAAHRSHTRHTHSDRTAGGGVAARRVRVASVSGRCAGGARRSALERIERGVAWWHHPGARGSDGPGGTTTVSRVTSF